MGFRACERLARDLATFVRALRGAGRGGRRPFRLLALALAIALGALVAAQPPPAPGGQDGRGRGGRGGPPPIDPLVMGDHTGFQSIFDGSTLKGWDGDPAFWRAENGTIVGQSTEQNPVKQNTFLIWRGGEPADFELKVEFRMNSTNSGVQFRSVQLPAGPDVGKWVMKGYQADIDFANQWTGQLYEERGRGFLALRGQAVYIPDGGRPKVIGNLQQTADELKAIIKVNDWNQVHIIARGTTIMQILNGAVTSIVVADDAKNRALSGLLGFQMHVGPPMKLELRNVWLKKL
jgi:3-keto-disaccharide hydrolase